MPTTTKVEMIPVRSSNIDAIGFDSERSVLVVRFNEGRTYEYENVTPSEYALLAEIAKRGASISSVFNLISSNPTKYPYKKV